MKDFKEYIEEKEVLNESALAIASAIGFAAISPYILWGASVIVSAYAKGFRKAIQGISRSIRTLRGKKNVKLSEIQETVEDMRHDTSVRKMQRMVSNIEKEYADELQPVLEAIKSKNVNQATNEYENLSKELKRNNDVKLVLIEAVSEALGQPPLHFGEKGKTGNEAYMFIKKMIDLRTARAAAIGSQKALEKYAPELIGGDVKKEIEKEEEN